MITFRLQRVRPSCTTKTFKNDTRREARSTQAKDSRDHGDEPTGRRHWAVRISKTVAHYALANSLSLVTMQTRA